MKVKNIFSDVPQSVPEEIFENLISSENCKSERIVSRGHTTPEEKWYDQDKNEFVLILRGNAELLFKEKNELVKMKEGDYVNIPAHKKHRVEKTSTEKETIWLVIHYK